MLQKIRGCDDVQQELDDLIKAKELSSKSSVQEFVNLESNWSHSQLFHKQFFAKW